MMQAHSTAIINVAAPLEGRIAVLLIAVKRGDRVAQLIVERIATPEVQEVENLDDTVRGSGGYGSTGQ